MSGLSAGRSGKYFKLYQDDQPLQRRSFKELCSALGLRDVGYGHDALRLTATELRPEIVSKAKFFSILNSFLDAVEWTN